MLSSQRVLDFSNFPTSGRVLRSHTAHQRELEAKEEEEKVVVPESFLNTHLNTVGIEGRLTKCFSGDSMKTGETVLKAWIEAEYRFSLEEEVPGRDYRWFHLIEHIQRLNDNELALEMLEIGVQQGAYNRAAKRYSDLGKVSDKDFTIKRADDIISAALNCLLPTAVDGMRQKAWAVQTATQAYLAKGEIQLARQLFERSVTQQVFIGFDSLKMKIESSLQQEPSEPSMGIWTALQEIRNYIEEGEHGAAQGLFDQAVGQGVFEKYPKLKAHYETLLAQVVPMNIDDGYMADED